MREQNDWRLTNQLRYLKGVVLTRRVYTPPSATWEHDHCEFCRAKFMAEDHADVLHEGYATPDEGRWVCKTCFDDFKDLFEWQVQ